MPVTMLSIFHALCPLILSTNIVITILLMSKVGLKEVNKSAQGRPGGRWQSQDSYLNPSSPRGSAQRPPSHPRHYPDAQGRWLGG